MSLESVCHISLDSMSISNHRPICLFLLRTWLPPLLHLSLLQKAHLPSPFGCCVSLMVLPLPVACNKKIYFLHHLFLLCYSHGFPISTCSLSLLLFFYTATTGFLLKHTNETAHNMMTRGVDGRNGSWCIQNKSIQFLFPIGRVPSYNSPVTYHSTCPLKTCSAPISCPKLEALGGQGSCQSHIPSHPSHHLEHIARGSW